MSPLHAKFPAAFFCITRARARVRSPSQHYDDNKTTQSYFKKSDHHDNSEFSSKSSSSSEIRFSGNRVMVVVDSSLEAKAALQWALSHIVQTQDTMILLHISNPTSKNGVISNPKNQKACQLLCSMKNTCQMRRPEMEVEIAVREGKEKAAMIVEEAKQRKVSLLVLGQRKRSIMWRLQKMMMMMWAGRKSTRRRRRRRSNNRVVDYCIQNANCMTIAVRRRKGRKHGGYLITTKRHKNFWLLA